MIYEASLVYDNDVVIAGNRCITSLQELYQVLVYKDTTEIRIHKDFAEEYFTPSGLSDFVQNAQMVNPYCVIVVDADVRDFHLKAVRALSNYSSIEEVMYMLQARPREMLDVLKMLCANYTDTYSETLVANNKVSSLQLQNAELLRKLEEADSNYKQLLHDKSLVDAQLGMLVGRINNSYEKNIDPSKFLQIEGKSKFTKILYIKEVTRVRYIDTLLYYLKEILKTLYGVPAREVVIAPYYAYGGAKLYPGFQPSFDLSYSQLYQSDIYMPGFQPSVMSDILQNPSNVEYLIILDRCGFEQPHILGDSVEYVYTMSDLSDNIDRIDPKRVISYSHNTLFVPYIEGFDQLSVEERMVKYSSTKIMKHLLELLETR